VVLLGSTDGKTPHNWKIIGISFLGRSTPLEVACSGNTHYLALWGRDHASLEWDEAGSAVLGSDSGHRVMVRRHPPGLPPGRGYLEHPTGFASRLKQSFRGRQFYHRTFPTD
jgi:hypothetical protein